MKQSNRLHTIKNLSIGVLLFAALLTGCNKDEDPGIRPQVISTGPVTDAKGISLNTAITAVFSVPMEASTDSKLTLKQGTSNITGTSHQSGAAISFAPTSNLLPNTEYTATISRLAADESGTSMVKDYTWKFSTGSVVDNVKPTVMLSNPADHSLGIALNQAVVFTFSETMDASTLNSLNFSVNQGSTAVAGVVTSTGTTVTFTPSANFKTEKIYTATLKTGAKDMAGNSVAIDHVVTFTTGIATDISLPMVNATNPLHNATDIAHNQIVSITFSEAMDPSTITTSSFILKEGENVIDGTVSYSLKTATFTPSEFLTAGLVYTATITTAAKDLAGNALAALTKWTFTASNNAATLAAVNLRKAGNYVILAKTAINNSSTSAITGDIALSPAATSYITGLALTDFTGFATSSQLTGKVYAADMASPTPVNLTTAVENMITAYNDAAGRPSPDFLELGTGSIGGRTLTPGLYKWTTTVSLASDVVISGGANDVWIFQISGDLSMSSAVKITLTGGAQAKNIFWQVSGQATLGTTSHFEGIILSMTGITFQTGASMKGRALAQTAVILDSNAVTKPY